MAADDVLKVLADRVKTYRHAAGLSQERLAVKAGLTRATIGNIETARQNVTVTTLVAIAGVLGVCPADPLPGDTDSDETQRALLRCQETNQRLLARISAARAALDGGDERVGSSGGES